MAEMTYFPQKEEELLTWLKNFSDHLPVTGVELGITPAEIASLNALILSVKQSIRNGSEEKELKREAMMKFLMALVKKMKNHPLYKQSEHGSKLGIFE